MVFRCALSEWQASIIVNTDGALHRRYGVTKEALYLCRPDHHIGYRSQPVIPDLFMAYLEQNLVSTTG